MAYIGFVNSVMGHLLQHVGIRGHSLSETRSPGDKHGRIGRFPLRPDLSTGDRRAPPRAGRHERSSHRAASEGAQRAPITSKPVLGCAAHCEGKYVLGPRRNPVGPALPCSGDRPQIAWACRRVSAFRRPTHRRGSGPANRSKRPDQKGELTDKYRPHGECRLRSTYVWGCTPGSFLPQELHIIPDCT